MNTIFLEDEGDFEEGLEEDVPPNEDNLGYDDVIDADAVEFDGGENDDDVEKEQIDVTSKESAGDVVDLAKNNVDGIVAEQADSNDADTNVSSSRDSTSFKGAEIEQVVTSSGPASPSRNGTHGESLGKCY